MNTCNHHIPPTESETREVQCGSLTFREEIKALFLWNINLYPQTTQTWYSTQLTDTHQVAGSPAAWQQIVVSCVNAHG